MGPGSAGGGGLPLTEILTGVGVFFAVVALIVIAGSWKMFTKANRSGWESIIPIYNMYVLLRIVGRPSWWLLLYFIPPVNVVVAVVNMNDLSKSFGKGAGFTLGLLFLPFIFTPILGFGKARYLGPAASSGQNQNSGVPSNNQSANNQAPKAPNSSDTNSSSGGDPFVS